MPVRVILCCALLGSGAIAHCQTATPAKMTTAPSSYIAPNSLPPNAREYLYALGNRLQFSGSERLTLVGTSTDGRGTGAAQLVWELPGSVRLDRQTSAAGPLIYVHGSGAANAASLSQADADLLENLVSDSHEAFLVSFGQKVGHRLLGTRLRVNNGGTGNTGPYYDLFETVGPDPAANNAVRQKWYFFDSGTRLLAKTRYLIKRNGTDLAVECQYSNWTTQQGQSFPAQIVRTENGAPVFTLKLSQASIGPALNDGIFSGH